MGRASDRWAIWLAAYLPLDNYMASVSGMALRTILVCDICGTEEEIKTTPLSHADLAQEVGYVGWWQPVDGDREICPAHPRPVNRGAA